MLKFQFIKKLIEDGKISPAMGRLIESSIISGIAYAMGVMYEGKLFSIQGLIQAILLPLWMYINKLSRDRSISD